jgi:hypothetical protein
LEKVTALITREILRGNDVVCVQDKRNVEAVPRFTFRAIVYLYLFKDDILMIFART